MKFCGILHSTVYYKYTWSKSYAIDHKFAIPYPIHLIGQKVSNCLLLLTSEKLLRYDLGRIVSLIPLTLPAELVLGLLISTFTSKLPESFSLSGSSLHFLGAFSSCMLGGALLRRAFLVLWVLIAAFH